MLSPENRPALVSPITRMLMLAAADTVSGNSPVINVVCRLVTDCIYTSLPGKPTEVSLAEKVRKVAGPPGAGLFLLQDVTAIQQEKTRIIEMCSNTFLFIKCSCRPNSTLFCNFRAKPGALSLPTCHIQFLFCLSLPFNGLPKEILHRKLWLPDELLRQRDRGLYFDRQRIWRYR